MPKLPKNLRTRPIDLRPVVVQPETVAVVARPPARAGRARERFSDRPATGSAAAMRSAEGLVQVQVHHVDADVARAG